MSKKLSLTFFFSLVISIVALNSAGVDVAQGAPQSCLAGNNYEIVPSPNFDFPFTDTDGSLCGVGNAGAIAWVYRINELNAGTLEKITKVQFLIHSTSDDLIEMHIPSGGKVYPRGNTKSGWAEDIHNGIVVVANPLSGGSSTYSEVVICSKTVDTYGTIAVAIGTAKEDIPCVAEEVDAQGPTGGIIGVGTEKESALLAQLVDTEISFPDNGKAFARYSKDKPCIQKFLDKDKNEITPSPPGWLQEGKETVAITDVDNKGCKQAVLTIQGSPIQYWGYSHPYYYCLGYYYPNPPYNPAAWVSPCP